MIREIIGGKTVASMLMPRKRRKMMMPSVSTIGILAGAGIAYMAMRKNKQNNDDILD